MNRIYRIDALIFLISVDLPLDKQFSPLSLEGEGWGEGGNDEFIKASSPSSGLWPPSPSREKGFAQDKFIIATTPLILYIRSILVIHNAIIQR